MNQLGDGKERERKMGGVEIKGYISISQLINIVIYSDSSMEGIQSQILSLSLYVNRSGELLFLFF